MSRPLVALACVTEQWDGVAHPAVRQAYVTALERVAGCDVVLLPGPGEGLAEQLHRFDGLVLGGHGSNVAPEHYGAPPAAGPRAPERDRLALGLLPAALRLGLPVLGVCRGLQEINVALGGTLRTLPDGAHQEDLSLPRDEQYRPAHSVRLTPGGLLRGLLGADRVRVNSLHQQAVDRLAEPLRVEAVAADGVVEAVSAARGGSFLLGVQWHPEWYAESDPVSGRIFRAFAAAAHAPVRRAG